MDVDGLLNDLRRALRRLRTEQGRIARRNARLDVGLRVIRIKRVVEEEFPAIAAPRKVPRRRRGGLEMIHHMHATWESSVGAHRPDAPTWSSAP